MKDDGDLNRIMEESVRIRELARERGASGEERPRSVPTEAEEKRRPAPQGGKKKKKRKKGGEVLGARFHQELKILPRSGLSSSSSTFAQNKKAPPINMNMITRKAKLSMKEFQLIETRIADTNALTTTLPEHLTQCLESYVDKSDEAMMNIVSRTEAEAAFMSSDYEFTTEQIQLLLNASMEHVEDPNSVLYKKLVAKAVKLYRFNFVVNQLGSTSARRAAGYAADPDMGMSSIAEDSEASMDPHAAFLNSMQGGPNPPASHNLPPLRIQEAIATRHLQKDGNYDNNYGRSTPHILQSHGQTSIQELRRELELSERGLEQLQAEVKKGVQWVQLHCPTSVKNNRAKKYCKQWGVEKLKRFLMGQEAGATHRAFETWLDYCQFGRNTENLQKYIKIKACSKIYSMLTTFCLRQQAHGLNQWKNAVIAERNREYNYCSIEMERIVRGFLGRCYTKELRRDAAACKIQNRWKCKKAGEITKALRAQKEKNDAATFLQTRYRNYRSRGEAKAIMWGKKENKSATLLQSRMRGRDDRARVQRLREEKEMNKSAGIMQRRFRGFEARKEVVAKREEKRRNDAASKIQRKQRGLTGQLIFAHKKLEKDSANKIQGAVRIHLAKKTTAGKLQAYMHKKKVEEEDKAARILQGKTRQFSARKRVGTMRAEKEAAEQDKAARIMQGKTRQFNARKKVEKKRAQKTEEMEQNQAATIMQGRFRMHESKKLVNRKKESKRFEEEEKKRRWEAQNDATLAAEMEEQDKAARIMQGKARQFGARKEVNKKRTAKLKNKSAKIVQRAYRTHRFLMRFNRKAHERKKRWMAEAEQRAKEEEEKRIKKEEREAAYAKKKAELELAEQNTAATKIQVVFRGRRARRKMEARRSELAVLEAEAEKKRIAAEQNASAQMIANFMRISTAKIRVRKKKAEHQRKLAELEAAGDLGAAEIEKMKKEMMAEIQAMELSADMQAAQDKKDLDRAKNEASEALAAEQALEAEQDVVEQERAALQIQHAWRQRKSRIDARKKRKEKIALMERMKEEARKAEEEEEAREALEMQLRAQMEADRRKKKLEKEKQMHKSATKIQGCYRTRMARRKVVAKKAAKMKEAEKHSSAAEKLRRKIKEVKQQVSGLKGMAKEQKIKEIQDMEAKAQNFDRKAQEVRQEAIMGAAGGEMAVQNERGRFEKEQQMKLQMMEDAHMLEDSALKIQGLWRRRAARKVLEQRKEIARMREQSADMRYVAPSLGPKQGTFIRPGSIHRLEKFSGEMTHFGDDMEANMDAMAAEFVKRENAKAAKEFAERRKVEKEKAVQDLAIAKKEFSLAFGEDFDVADKKSVEAIIQSGVEESKKAAEHAASRAAQEAEVKMSMMEKKFELRLKQLEQWEQRLELREKSSSEMGAMAESQKLMALHAQANADNAQAQMVLQREREEFETEKRSREAKENMLGSNSTAMVSSNPEEMRASNMERQVTPSKANKETWKKQWDNEAKAFYYMNESTNEAQWERPGAGARVIEDDAGGKSGGEVTDYDTDNPNFAGDGGGGGGGGTEWQEFQDQSTGTKYWYSSKTGESVWEDPNKGGGGGGGGGGGAGAPTEMDREAAKWVSHIDPGTGVAYWYNSETQETKWEE
ncbi:hypothetical protein TeGR_g14543 [Tetraparma gracilis]|uniref:WW domain-containing protein n=1 Tax=Tetraparma gracilis TaxID=2962635 RepID=A0ABQ6MAZ9_9STRA|nr:hypothetical protein TeGR_g14543 [Tetraparma gracilis]